MKAGKTFAILPVWQFVSPLGCGIRYMAALYSVQYGREDGMSGEQVNLFVSLYGPPRECRTTCDCRQRS